MGSDMLMQVASLCKRFLTNRTLIGFLFGVSSDVICQGTTAGKTSLTNGTLCCFAFI